MQPRNRPIGWTDAGLADLADPIHSRPLNAVVAVSVN